MELNRQLLDIAYSSLNIAPINTVEHYWLAASCGFPALKGDIRPTADGALVMCHDRGFTFDADGRITRFNPDDNKPILDMNFRECLSLEYNSFHDSLGYCARVTPYEDFVRICAETGKVCFTTIRDERIPQASTEMLRIIKKYSMEDRLIVNSFSYEALEETRKYSQTIPVSHVQPYCKILTKDTVDAASDLGNAIISMFSFPGNDSGFDCILASAPVIEYALSRNIIMFQAILDKQEDRERAIQFGFSGFQISRLFAPYALPLPKAAK